MHTHAHSHTSTRPRGLGSRNTNNARMVLIDDDIDGTYRRFRAEMRRRFAAEAAASRRNALEGLRKGSQANPDSNSATEAMLNALHEHNGDINHDFSKGFFGKAGGSTGLSQTFDGHAVDSETMRDSSLITLM